MPNSRSGGNAPLQACPTVDQPDLLLGMLVIVHFLLIYCLARKTFYIIWLSNLSILSVPDEICKVSEYIKKKISFSAHNAFLE
jgi:hypothetical protein